MPSEHRGKEAPVVHTALITGASSGIGKAVAAIMAANDWHVFLAARRRDRLEACVEDLRQRYAAEAAARATDVTQAHEVRTLVAAAIERLGHLDVVVNAAGHGQGWGAIDQAPAALWQNLIETNLLGSLLVIASCLPHMRQRDRGHIVNVGSIFARTTTTQWGAYAATKHGLRAFTQTLRQELAGTNIRVSLVHPGSVATEFSAVAAQRAPHTARLADWPYRPLLPEDVAEAIWWIVTRPAWVDVSELVIQPTAERQFG